MFSRGGVHAQQVYACHGCYRRGDVDGGVGGLRWREHQRRSDVTCAHHCSFVKQQCWRKRRKRWCFGCRWCGFRCPENEALKAPDKTDYLGISYPTDQGAQATARYFIDAMYYGYATGDTGPLESVTDHASCVECTELINDIHSWRDEGKYLTPARVKLDDEWTVDKSEDLTKTEYWFTVDELQIRRQDSSIKLSLIHI